MIIIFYLHYLCWPNNKAGPVVPVYKSIFKPWDLAAHFLVCTVHLIQKDCLNGLPPKFCSINFKLF